MSQTGDTYLRQLQACYRRASKKEKTGILDEFAKMAGYHRKHAAAVLNGRPERGQCPIRRPRRAQYGTEEAYALAILIDLRLCIDELQEQLLETRSCAGCAFYALDSVILSAVLTETCGMSVVAWVGILAMASG